MNKNKLHKLLSLSESIHLLYVEDNKNIRETTGAILKIFFPNFHVANDGEEGLKLFAKNSIDLIITDINMPNMDGLQMSKEIKSINDNVEIIITSAYNEKNYLIKSQKMGITTYLHKPVDLQQLVETLIQTLQEMKKKEALV